MSKKLKNGDAVRRLYNLTVQTSANNNLIPFRPRFINKWYAHLMGYFWLPCHKCGKKFGGHEWYGSEAHQGICPRCVLKRYNETGSLNE